MIEWLGVCTSVQTEVCFIAKKILYMPYFYNICFLSCSDFEFGPFVALRYSTALQRARYPRHHQVLCIQSNSFCSYLYSVNPKVMRSQENNNRLLRSRPRFGIYTLFMAPWLFWISFQWFMCRCTKRRVNMRPAPRLNVSESLLVSQVLCLAYFTGILGSVSCHLIDAVNYFGEANGFAVLVRHNLRIFNDSPLLFNLWKWKSTLQFKLLANWRMPVTVPSGILFVEPFVTNVLDVTPPPKTIMSSLGNFVGALVKGTPAATAVVFIETDIVYIWYIYNRYFYEIIYIAYDITYIHSM